MPSLPEMVRGLGCCMAPPARPSSPSDCPPRALATCKLGFPPTAACVAAHKQQEQSTSGNGSIPQDELAGCKNESKPGSVGQRQMANGTPAPALNGSHSALQAAPAGPAAEGHNCIATSASPFASSPFEAAVAAAASDQKGEGAQLSPLASRGTMSAVSSTVSAEFLDAATQLGKLEQTLGQGGAHGKDHKGGSRGSSRQDLAALGSPVSGRLSRSASNKGPGAAEGRESGGTQSRSSGTNRTSINGAIRTSSNGEACIMRRGKSLGILQPMTSDQARSRKEKNAIAAAAAAVTRATSLNAVQTASRDRSQAGPTQNRGISRTVASEADLQRLLNNKGSPRSSASNEAAKVRGKASQLGRSSSSSRLGGPALVRRLMSMGRSETPSAIGPITQDGSAGAGGQIAHAAASSPSNGSFKGKADSGGDGSVVSGGPGSASKSAGLRQAQSSGSLLFPQASYGSLASLGSGSSANMGGAAMLLAASMEILQGRVTSGEMDPKEDQLRMSQSGTSLSSAQVQESSSSSTTSGPRSIKDGSSLAPLSSFSSTLGAPTTPEGIARTFGESFLKAMMTGDTKWGSHPELMSMFSDTAILIGHDGQRYEGRAAIIRRLNTGMEQFLQMMGFRDDVSEEAQRDMAARASQVETSMEVSALPPSGKKGPHGRNSSVIARPKPAQYSRGAVGDAGGGVGNMSVILVTYNFKAGFRRFKLQDRFKVRHNKITRLQRTRG